MKISSVVLFGSLVSATVLAHGYRRLPDGSNHCINTSHANVANTGFGGTGIAGKTRCAHKSSMTAHEWNKWAQNEGWADDNYTQFTDSVFNAQTEYLCTSGMGGDGFGTGSGNTSVFSLQNCVNEDVGINEVGLYEGPFFPGMGDFDGFNSCINTSAASVANIGHGGFGEADRTKCWQRSKMEAKEWNNVFQNAYEAGDHVDVGALNYNDAGVRFVCMAGMGGDGFGSGSGNTSAQAIQACENGDFGF